MLAKLSFECNLHGFILEESNGVTKLRAKAEWHGLHFRVNALGDEPHVRLNNSAY